MTLTPPGGWYSSGARIPVPPPERRGFAFRGLSRAARLFGRSQMPDIFSVFNINARLFWAWLFFASRLMPYGRLPGRERELVILRVAWNCRCRYEWGQHVEVALRNGVTDAEIGQVTRGPQAFAGARERALLAACDELFRDKCIGDATWTALRQHYSPKLLIEISILSGHYEMLAGFLNSAGLELEPSIEEILCACERRLAAMPETN